MRLLPLTIVLAAQTGCAIWGQDRYDEYLAEFDADGDGEYTVEAGGTDCDDTNPAINTMARDVCDDIDNNCNGELDEEPEGILYPDLDGDGYGIDAPENACPGEGWADVGTGANEDCDDGAPLVNPGANEVCNDLDDDCDGVADNTDADWYADVDGDTFGDFNTASDVCQPGYVSNATDCDDGEATINPGADELCDGIDQDCDETIDNDPVDPDTFYEDVDDDGFGDTASTTDACARPSGYAEVDGDCDDADEDVYPNAEELCDSKDNDCDGDVDETPPNWYADTDNDGHGDASVSQPGCEAPSPTGWSSKSDDCNDDDPDIYPLAPERCNDIDDDCDVTIDEDPVDPTTWFNDGDDDGYGGTSPSQVACDQPDGYVDNNEDCNDSVPDINPETVWYPDTDSDDFGNPSGSTMTQCTQPTGHVRDATDCNDDDAAINPATIWFPDSDGDDYGETGGTTMVQCATPANHVLDNTDCDDSDAAVNPLSEWWDDNDEDGYGDEDDTNPTVQCVAPPKTALEQTDCDDGDAAINPGAAPSCTSGDVDCNGIADDDFDGDGFIRPACPGGYDCDDTDATANLTPAGKDNGSCAGLYNDCTALQSDYPNVEDGVYWLSPRGLFEKEFYCDHTTDGGGWTLVVSTEAGDTSTCGSATRFSDAKNVTTDMAGDGGEVLSKFFPDDAVTGAPESVLQFVLTGSTPYTHLNDLFTFPDSTAAWEVDASTAFGLDEVSGTDYGAELYWNYGEVGLGDKRHYCIGGAASSGSEQACVWDSGSSCGLMYHAGEIYDGPSGSVPVFIHSPATHELYVRAP